MSEEKIITTIKMPCVAFTYQLEDLMNGVLNLVDKYRKIYPDTIWEDVEPEEDCQPGVIVLSMFDDDSLSGATFIDRAKIPEIVKSWACSLIDDRIDLTEDEDEFSANTDAVQFTFSITDSRGENSGFRIDCTTDMDNNHDWLLVLPVDDPADWKSDLVQKCLDSRNRHLGL